MTSTLQPLDNDPLGQAEELDAANVKRNFAKVGSARPSSLLYTYGPGAIIDLPNFTVMPDGYDDWGRIFDRRNTAPTVHAPRLLDVVRLHLGRQVRELRPFPHQPVTNRRAREGSDLGVPARVFPQWLRCTGCDLLGPLTKFTYINSHPYRPDKAQFEHEPCPGRGRHARRGKGARRQPAVPARYLLVCLQGHLDEFPYDLWVHRGGRCAKAEIPVLKMWDRAGGRGAAATVVCESCNAQRPMNEAQGEAGRAKLPPCRGRHPHLDDFDACGADSRLMVVGASNLWFPVTHSIIVMPTTTVAERLDEQADRLRSLLGDNLAQFHDQPKFIRALLQQSSSDLVGLPDEDLSAVIQRAVASATPAEDDEGERATQLRNWDPITLLVPEWAHLTRPSFRREHDVDPSGLTLTPREIQDFGGLPQQFTQVTAVDRLRKVNALVGFTRVDGYDRVDDVPARLVKLSRTPPSWTVATEDRGEGIFLTLDEQAVRSWERRVEDSDIWRAHVEAHRRNFRNRTKEDSPLHDASDDEIDARLKPARYWLIHTLAHVLIRTMAMQCGYSAASLSERLYAWPGTADRDPAAGLLICTTASDSDGTLGGLVQLSHPDRLASVVRDALARAHRCSSDPVCAYRTPKDPEEFLHGAACHACTMASETSCERANRFLDRRFLVDLPGSHLGFFD